VLYNAVYTTFSVTAGKIADKIGKTKVFLVGLIIYALVYVCFALNKSIWGVFALFFVYGFYIAMTDGISKAIAGSIVDKDRAGTAYGLMQTVIGLSTLLASVIGGFLWTMVGPYATFYFGSACAILAFFFLIIKFRTKQITSAI
jgi:MFS family permease